jgi:hypothetical protein
VLMEECGTWISVDYYIMLLTDVRVHVRATSTLNFNTKRHCPLIVSARMWASVVVVPAH